MNLTQKSAANAVMSVSQIILNGIFVLILTRTILVCFNSDFNGVNSMVLQAVNALMIIEGGFTLAANVALLRPLSDNDWKSINGILAATQKRFLKLGLFFLGLGFVLAFVYSLFINSQMAYKIIVSMFIMTVLPNAFNMMYAIKYQALLQAQQKEYIISFTSALTLSMGYITTILMLRNGSGILTTRFVPMAFSFVNSISIGLICKRLHPRMDIGVEPDFNKIKGTRDVFISKIMAFLFNSLPVLLMPVLNSQGSMLVSVYSVYNSVFSFLKNLLITCASAPRFGFGAIMLDRDKNKVYNVFLEYEHIIFMALCSVTSTAAVLIMPFVALYTKGINDIEYERLGFALLFCLINMIQITEIPSGQMINMAGAFNVGKKNQVAACIILALTLPVGVVFIGVYGVLISVLLASVVLAYMEMRYTLFSYFHKGLWDTLRLWMASFMGAAVAMTVELEAIRGITGYIQLFAYGAVLLICNTAVVLLINLAINREKTKSILARLVNLIKKRRVVS